MGLNHDFQVQGMVLLWEVLLLLTTAFRGFRGVLTPPIVPR
jgi:hypothetical protein